MAMTKKRFHYFSLWLPVVMLALVPLLTDFLENRHEAALQDLALPGLSNLLSATLCTTIFFRAYRKDRLLGYVAAIFATLLVTNRYEDRLHTLLPILRSLNPLMALASDALYSLIFFLVIIALSYWVGHLASRFVTKKKWDVTRLSQVITIIVGFTFVFQLLPTIQTVTIAWSQFFYRPPAFTSEAKVTAKGRPDIYYIVLDRYTNQSVLTEQLHFDNTDFLNFLKDNQFTIDSQAHSAYPYTTMSIASTLNANYLTGLINKFASASAQTLTPYHLAIRYAGVIKELKKLGYQYYHLGSWYDATSQAPLADQNYQLDGRLTVFGHFFFQGDFAKNEITQSLFWHWLNPGLRLGQFNILTYNLQKWDAMSLYQLESLKELARQPADGRFIFTHILVPHDPYFFNADGSRSQNADTNNVGKPIKQKYTDQVQFINGQMKALISEINARSQGRAIIVLQADEGPYPMQLNGNNFNIASVSDNIVNKSMINWSDQDLRMKFGTLAAYRVPGATPAELEQAGDAVNIFRLIFNTLFGDRQPYLPRCAYAYPDGRVQPFMYTEITERLTGQANSACPTTSPFVASDK